MYNYNFNFCNYNKIMTYKTKKITNTNSSIKRINFFIYVLANTVEFGYYDISTDREKSVVKSELSL